MTLQLSFSNTSSQDRDESEVFEKSRDHFLSLITSHTPCLCSVQCHWCNYSLISTLLGLYPQSSITQHTFQRSPCSIPSTIQCTTSLSHPPSASTCDHRYLKQSTSSYGLPFSITCIRPPFPYLEHHIHSQLSSCILHQTH